VVKDKIAKADLRIVLPIPSRVLTIDTGLLFLTVFFKDVQPQLKNLRQHDFKFQPKRAFTSGLGII